MLVRVEAPYFVAGLIFKMDVCVQAAPILRNACLGRNAQWCRSYFEHKGWKATIVRGGLCDEE
jgi:hypothetical protein